MFILVHSKLELHPVFSETLRISTKKSTLDHLHHNQENDLETPQETHSPWPTLRLLILNTSRTYSQSQQTQKRIVQQITKITLVTDEYLKSIQVESYSSTLINHKTLKQSQHFENSLRKNFVKRFFSFLNTVFLNIFKDIVCYQILTNS